MEIWIVILSSTWKFAATFPVAVYVFKMTFFQTILYTNIGGLLGMVVSAILSKGLIKIYIAFWPEKLRKRIKKSKKFTRRNRLLVNLKSKYGLMGIAFLTPVLLSIPLGTFLVAKYYRQSKHSYGYLLFSQLIWSLVFTVFYFEIKTLF